VSVSYSVAKLLSSYGAALAIISTALVLSVSAQAPSDNNRQGTLQVAFELASDFHLATERQRASLLSVIDERGAVSDQEITFSHSAFKASPDSKYRSLAPAETTDVYAYIRALRTSYARFQGAQTDGNEDWSAKQLNAAQQYAALLAKALVLEAQQDEHDVARLSQFPFAVRRSPADQVAFLEKLKTSGLTPEHRRLMKESGRTEAEITTFQQQLFQLPADKVGASPVEMLSRIASSRRELAAELSAFANATSGALAGVSAEIFDIGNPHDREETIDLFIRPISIPPDWKLAIADTEEQAKFKVREVDPGKHYAVTLPAKAQVKVASVVVPVGEVGTNTTARWAVEGKIGNELIGGMVHEMNVPYIIPDLQLPPVGSKEVEEEVPVPGRAWSRIVAEVAAGIAVLALLIYFLFIWRRRRRKTHTA